MASVEMRGGSVGRGGIDPSNLHLKKELTQIRKAARNLRDPGTSSSWRSPLNSAPALTKHHYVHHQKNLLDFVDGKAISSLSEQCLQRSLNVESNGNSGNVNVTNDKGNVNVKEKQKMVFLYNWKSQKSEGEVNRQMGVDDIENSKNVELYLNQESVDIDNMSDGRDDGGNDSKSDAYSSDRYASAIFKCKDTRFSPSIRRTIRKKSKRSNYSSASLWNHNEKLRKQMPLTRGTKNVVEGSPSLGMGRYDLASLVDQSDDTEDYCNSEDLRRVSAISPLLAKLKSKGWAHSPKTLLRSHRKEDDSISYSTPALSTSSYNKHGITNPSIIESWDATTGSINDADDEVDDQLDFPGKQGCGIPCYWSRRSTPKSRIGCGSCSPSLSDTLRRKGSSILCGTRTMYHKRHHRSTMGSIKRRTTRTGAESVASLLANSGNGQGGSSMGSGSGNSDDEISTNFGELDLEALSRLDGRRWSSSCRSQEGLELEAFKGEMHEESSPENVRSLCHRYRPMFFDELVGQNIVVQSLTSAINRARIAPVYLFQGPRGTGKTSAARIFATALNCLATDEAKPCGVCRECSDSISGKNRYLKEVDGSNKKGINNIRTLLKNLSVVHLSASSQYKIFIIDECHLLPSKTWLTFLRLLEKLQPRVVFILITTDIDNIPRTILSRCQKHLFSKISNGDIITRLRKIATDENLDVELEALDLIASNADGSLRDAETMLDQLSLFGKRISISLVNELIGVVSDEKLLELLELAMSSNATETVIRARELMDSGVDPIVLMSQMATLIVDIIAGTYPTVDARHNDSFIVSEREVDRLKRALTLLSEAEKHLRLSSERSTWFTATLLQLGSLPSPDQSQSGSSRRQSSKATEEDRMSILKEAAAQKQRTDGQFLPKLASPSSFVITATNRNSTNKENPISLTCAASFDSNTNQNQFLSGEGLRYSHDDFRSAKSSSRSMDSKMLIDIWLQCIEKCHSKTLRQLLHSHGKLVSISEFKGGFVAHIAFGDSNIKTRAEGFLSSITNSFEIVLRHNVEVKIILVPDSSSEKQMDKNIAINLENKSTRSNITGGNSDLDLRHVPLKVSRGNFNVSEGHQIETSENTSASKERKKDIPGRRIESIIHEQRLETAWLQAMEKGTPGSMSCLKPERNQILPQDGMYNPNDMELMNSRDVVPMKHWEDELNHEIKALKKDEMQQQKEHVVKGISHCPISPSLLHNSSFARDFNKDNMGYESGSGAGGCTALFCWNNTRTHRRGKGPKGTPINARQNGRFSWFGVCAKSRRTSDNRYGR
ncbi:LOW QUALITY PROTEIN: protein STICHEL-like [Henckelia pumila]|uniref:LOW QUALITY PROTEIN: protein STICHEL-like n=1 Tax=Henckelia pumila TaxID=405737 RepID=UPI003C6E3809